MRPSKQGLYDPSTEHDACGVGFVAQVKGQASRSIVDQGLEVLARLSHRAATGCDPQTGDGAGILLQLDQGFFARVMRDAGLAHEGPDESLRRVTRFAVGQVFLPQDPAARHTCEQALEQAVQDEGQTVIGWRDVPIRPEHLGWVARDVLPVFRQIFVRRRRIPPTAFERTLYVIRKVAENRIQDEGLDPEGRFHIASLSSEKIVYKGLLLAEQLGQFYPDLQDSELHSAIALVHSRFSTNTFPTWDLAQPFHYIAHNGEINTLQGNRNWMAARRSQLASAKFAGGLERLFPIIIPGKSDSAQFDNMLELLYLGGRSLAHAMMMMIPESWENDEHMDPARRDFYRYASTLMEPWDGPAAIAFTNGRIIGATLDRNGLRPARYVVTDDDRVILASEVGVIDVPAHAVRRKGRLQPGRMFLVDTEAGEILTDESVKQEIVNRWPYGRWLERNVFDLKSFPPGPAVEPLAGEALIRAQAAFGYTDEDLSQILAPMATTGAEPIGSMGVDTPLAALSDHAPTLPRYFHQLFAQVTNPAIDPIRESLVMSLATTIGPDGNSFEETPEQCHRLSIPSPILTTRGLARVREVNEEVFEPITLRATFAADPDVPDALEQAVDTLCRRAIEAIDDGYNVLVISDRDVDAERAPIPALLAVSAVHQHLVREGIRMQVGLIVETGEAREVHDFATLIGYGAAAVNPYLALDSVRALADGSPADSDTFPNAEEAERRYRKAIEKGLLKVMSKMGISTLHSYRGAQIFEAVGLDPQLIERHFTGTPSRLAGIGLAELQREALERHARGFGSTRERPDLLPSGGHYRWRSEGERHRWTPDAIAALQDAVRRNDPDRWQDYLLAVDAEDTALHTVRSLLELDPDTPPIPLEEVEPAAEIVRRFVTGAMSFGSISAEAHETLAVAMNRLGGRSNSGEGGEETHRFLRDAAGDLRRSAVKQVASGRFGVTTEYLVNADDLQIKVAQGAKPGEGGQLPGHKVDERIAKVRCSTPGVTLISPPPHHDIYSIEDLAQLIYDLQMVNPAARVSVKLVSEVGVGTIAAGVAKARAGCVVIAGYSGGTGASPLSSVQHAGLPWELGLAETQQVLVRNDLRGRIRVQVDGGMRTGRDVVIGALLGGEEFGFATAALIATGCVMLRKCHLNTCSVGIATQREELRRRFQGQPEHVVNLMRFIAEDVRRYMARLGIPRFDDLVGRVDLLRRRERGDHYKAQRLDLSALLHAPEVPAERPRRFVTPVPWPVAEHVDQRYRARLEPALSGRRPVEVSFPVANTDRALGTVISGAIARRFGAQGLPDGTVRLRCSGSAGQSFGAFLTAGVTLELAGDANDYLGKGLAGGRIIVYPPGGSRFDPQENVICGNVVLYGATSGEVFISGLAGERFAVRNSGARAVVEGVGDHGCEYMTGGVVVVLGPTGRNFAAGMSGGAAFVFDRDLAFRRRCNQQMVDLEPLGDDSDIWLVRSLLEDHVRHTSSRLALRILDNWELMYTRFTKVMPVDLRRVLAERRAARTEPTQRPPLAIVDGGRS